MNVTILGCGALGEAIVGGLLASGATASSVRATARRPQRIAELQERHGIEVSNDNAAAVAGADVVVVAVKPQKAGELLPTLADALAQRLVVSVCAGVRLETLRGWLPQSRLIRAMPNTPALIREGMTVLSEGPGCTEADLGHGQSVFGSVGRCLVLEEKHMDAVTGLSGSGPAFAFVVLEALADGGVMMGLPRKAALELAAQTMQGAARLSLSQERHPAALKDDVTTPAGCTIAGLLTLEDGGIRSTLARAIQEATKVARGLGGHNAS